MIDYVFPPVSFGFPKCSCCLPWFSYVSRMFSHAFPKSSWCLHGFPTFPLCVSIVFLRCPFEFSLCSYLFLIVFHIGRYVFYSHPVVSYGILLFPSAFWCLLWFPEVFLSFSYVFLLSMVSSLMFSTASLRFAFVFLSCSQCSLRFSFWLSIFSLILL